MASNGVSELGSHAGPFAAGAGAHTPPPLSAPFAAPPCGGAAPPAGVDARCVDSGALRELRAELRRHKIVLKVKVERDGPLWAKIFSDVLLES